MADEKKQGLFGIEVDFSKDPDAERELRDHGEVEDRP